MKDNLMETFKQGLFLGMLLFICSLTALRLAAPEGVGPVWSLFPAVLSGYLAAGCFLQLIRSLAARLDSAFFRGAAAVSYTHLDVYKRQNDGCGDSSQLRGVGHTLSVIACRSGD